MKTLGRYDDYDWTPPTEQRTRITLTTYENAKYMLQRPQDFTVMWNDGLGFVMGPAGEKFCLGGDSAFHRKQKEIMHKLIYRDAWHTHVRAFYEQATLRLLREKSCTIAGIKQVDLTRDVGNLAHVHFAANMFSLPLKTVDNPKGIFTEHELWMAMSVIFTAIFFDFEPSKSFGLRQVARHLADTLGSLIEANVKSVIFTKFASRFLDSLRENDTPLSDYGIHMIRRLSETGMTAHEMAFSQIMPTAVAMVPNQSQVFTQIMDYYLGDGISHLPHIQQLALDNSEESEAILQRYVNEAIRLNGTFGSYRRSQTSHVFTDNGRQVQVEPGDKVFCSFVGAARDPNVFPDPDRVRLDRPLDSYIHYGVGDHTCLGKEASIVALTAMLRIMGRLKNLRRAPGPQGQLKKVGAVQLGTKIIHLTDTGSSPGWILRIHERGSWLILCLSMHVQSPL